VRLGTQDEHGLPRETRINRVFYAGRAATGIFETLLGFGSFVITLAALPAEQHELLILFHFLA